MLRLAFVCALAIACGAPASDSSTDAAPPPDAGLEPTCAGDACKLDCSPDDVALALNGGTEFGNLGDSDPATPEEVGDGKYHLFVGVQHAPDEVFIHDATSDSPGGPYMLGDPLVTALDEYDRFGIETPSYVRVDDTTEMVYYCGLYTSNNDPGGTKGRLSALRRVDGGSWTKVGPVAPFGPGGTSQCEPDVLRDPVSGDFHIFFIADGERPGLIQRTSGDPTDFDVASERLVSGQFSRPAVAFDPLARVYRFGFDVGTYPNGIVYTAQAHAATLLVTDDLLVANSEPSHLTIDGAVHPDVHLEAEGAVFQNGGPVFVGDDVLFFFTAFGSGSRMQVFTQRCTRR